VRLPTDEGHQATVDGCSSHHWQGGAYCSGHTTCYSLLS